MHWTCGVSPPTGAKVPKVSTVSPNKSKRDTSKPTNNFGESFKFPPNFLSFQRDNKLVCHHKQDGVTTSVILTKSNIIHFAINHFSISKKELENRLMEFLSSMSFSNKVIELATKSTQVAAKNYLSTRRPTSKKPALKTNPRLTTINYKNIKTSTSSISKSKITIPTTAVSITSKAPKSKSKIPMRSPTVSVTSPTTTKVINHSTEVTDVNLDPKTPGYTNIPVTIVLYFKILGC